MAPPPGYNLYGTNGTLLFQVQPLETLGPGNISTARSVLNIVPRFEIIQVTATSPNGTILISGDYSQWFPVNLQVEISGSPGNNGTYTVQSATYNNSTNETQIVFTTALPDPNSGGFVQINGFVLADDLTYRFLPGFTFTVSDSSIYDGNYTVNSFGSYSVPDTTGTDFLTIIPVTTTLTPATPPLGVVTYVTPDTSPTLRLPGRGVLNYGETLLQNLIWLTENFASEQSPDTNTALGTPTGTPLTGQLWYKPSEDTFYHYDGTQWISNWGIGSGSLIFTDPENPAQLYLTGAEGSIPGFTGSVTTGFVLWTDNDPPAGSPLFRIIDATGNDVVSVDFDSQITSLYPIFVNGTTTGGYNPSTIVGGLLLSPDIGSISVLQNTLTISGTGITLVPSGTTNTQITFDTSATGKGEIIFSTQGIQRGEIVVDDTNRTLDLNPTTVNGVTIAKAGGYVGIRQVPSYPVDIDGDTRITTKLGINNPPPTDPGVVLETTGNIKVNSQILVSDQSATAPAYAFTTDPDTGMFKSAAGTLGFAANGSEVFNVTSSTLTVNSGKVLRLDNAVVEWGRDTDVAKISFVDYGPDQDWLTIDFGDNAGDRVRYRFTTNGTYTNIIDIVDNSIQSYVDMFVNGNVVWHAGNDGPGSGLDADTFDGLDSTQFLRSDINDTFTGGTLTFQGNIAVDGTNTITFSDNVGSKINLNTTGTTIGIGTETDTLTTWSNVRQRFRIGGAAPSTGTEVVSITVDGVSIGGGDTATGVKLNVTGGNIKADQQVYFTDTLSTGTLTNDGVLTIGDIANTNLTIDQSSILARNNGAVATLDINKFGGNVSIWSQTSAAGQSPLTIGSEGYKVWHEGNSGSGSGLDADTLDGLDSSQFLRSDVNDTFTGTTLTINNALAVGGSATVSGNINSTLIDFADTVADKILFFNNTKGIGVETDGLTVWSGDRIKIRFGGTSSTTGAVHGVWTSTGLALGTNPADPAVRLDVSGDVRFRNNQQLDGKLYIKDTSDASLTTDGGLTIGDTAGYNVSIDSNEIIARNNGTPTSLGLNGDGGSVIVNGAIPVNGRDPIFVGSERFKVWHAGNDGPGSGLDADKLDGLDSTQFLRSDVDDTFTGTTLKISNYLHLTNTADASLTTNGALIIGDLTSLNITVDNNEIMARNNGAAAPLHLNVEGGVVTVNNSLSANNTNPITVGYEGYQVWHAGNDGPGSGLDADTLDGSHASDFALATHDHDTRYLQLTGGTLTGDLVINANLTVNGTQTILNTTTLAVADNIITLNDGFTSGTPTLDSGFEILRGSSPTVSLKWIEASDTWNVTRDGTNFFELLDAGNYTNYTVTKTGSGATGTWNISITGDANTLDGLDSTQFVRSDIDDNIAGSLFFNNNNALVIVNGTAPSRRTTGSGIELKGSTSSGLLTTQDGNGRISFKWNATYGINETFLVGNEHAGRIIFDSSSPATGLFRIDFAYGNTANPGDPINWMEIFLASTTTLRYKGYNVWHEGNMGAGSTLDADTVDGLHAADIVDEAVAMAIALG